MRLLFLALVVAACGQRSTPATTPPPAQPVADTAPAADPSIAPQLFTVEQLRAGNPQGRVIELRMEVDGKPPTVEHWEFTAVDGQQATIHAITRDEAGQVLADQSASSTWESLHAHGKFPAAATTIEDNVSVTVPAGTFTTRLYTVKRDGTTTRVWFAADLPGPPVQFTTEKDGKVIARATMLRAR